MTDHPFSDHPTPPQTVKGGYAIREVLRTAGLTFDRDRKVWTGTREQVVAARRPAAEAGHVLYEIVRPPVAIPTHEWFVKPLSWKPRLSSPNRHVWTLANRVHQQAATNPEQR